MKFSLVKEIISKETKAKISAISATEESIGCYKSGVKNGLGYRRE